MVKVVKNVKYELWNLYIIHNRILSFWTFWIFEISPKNQKSKMFRLFGVFVKEIVLFNIGFGFVVFKSIW